jgi:hypothetical protein
MLSKLNFSLVKKDNGSKNKVLTSIITLQEVTAKTTRRVDTASKQTFACLVTGSSDMLMQHFLGSWHNP